MVGTFPFELSHGAELSSGVGEGREGGLRALRYLERKHLRPTSGNCSYYNQVFLG